MKKIKITAICAIAFMSVALMSFTTTNNAALHSAVSNANKVLWAKESHDFGEIPQGKPVTVEFNFTNSGDEPLILADVKTSCGCTASDYTKEPIAPGRSSTIKVTYNAAALGSFTKAVTVNFSDAASQKVLTIKGTVK